MNKQTRSIIDDFRQLVLDAEALVAATADVSTETVAESRERLTVTLEQGKEICGRLSENIYDCALEAEEVVTKYTYHAICVGVGACLGYFAARGFTRKNNLKGKPVTSIAS